MNTERTEARMTDREALAAALEFFDGAAEFSLAPHFITTLAAARERLAQLPEKCEPAGVIHASTCVCGGSGRVYPILDQLGRTIPVDVVNLWGIIAVLDALNGETP